MAQPNPRVFSLPPGWGGATASRAPLKLLPAELFNRSFTPSPDPYLHVATLRAAPTGIVVASTAIAGLCGWLCGITFAGLAALPEDQRVMGIIIGSGFGLLGLFFLLVLLNLIVAAVSRGSWANRQCIGFGRSGIVLRLQGGAVDLPWAEVTAVRALAPDWQGSTARSRFRKVPVLLIQRGDEQWGLNPAVLNASPIGVYAMLHHYWVHPEQRAGLGTVAAQQKMDAYVASLALPAARM